MSFDSELSFLCDILKKAHLKTSIASPGDTLERILPSGFDSLFPSIYAVDKPLHNLIGKPEEHTMYKVTDALHLSYIYFQLPDNEKISYFFVGPYLRTPIDSQQIMEIAESNNITPKNQQYLEEYYSCIPVISDNSYLLMMLNTFCERIWNTLSFAVVDINNEWQLPPSLINESKSSDGFDDVMMNMIAMEKRYSFENELMQAVSLGQVHKNTSLLSSFSDQVFERRSSDPLRNMKNYVIIMNTLLRKAAEKGGVHPMYIDRLSSSFAFRLEQISALPEVVPLMHEMYKSYCRLVRKHSLQSYSPIVQKSIILIDSDLSANLSLHTLAESQNISPGYLSAVFRKETGKTISEFIREKRMKHAVHLLTTTHLQIQTVALHCGIMDVQYFSKIFKKHTGMTPKEYRAHTK